MVSGRGIMTDSKAMQAVVEQAYAARGKGNIDGLMAAFHADAVFRFVGDEKLLEMAGAIDGHPNVREAMTGLIANFEFIERHIISTIAEGNRAAVHSRVKIRFVPKDLTFDTEITDLFKFQDGKVIELVEFADTALIKELMT
jgi:ketosteroid isomerase-like protein